MVNSVGTTRKVLRRAGTTFLNVEEKFPDNESCLAHIISIRLDQNASCITCGKLRKFKKISKRNSYLSKCCTIRIVSPLEGTIFARTQISLKDWFRAILYFTNASMGISPNFISQQFGIARASSMRICQLIRQHLMSVDDDVLLGVDGSSVYVSVTTFKSISRRGGKNGTRFRVLMATDGVEVLIVPIHTGKITLSRHLLLDRLHPNAPIITQTDMLRKRIINFYKSSKVKGHNIDTSDDPYYEQFNKLSVCSIALKRFILQSHYSVSERHLESYVGHFAFLYRRRHRGHEAFWDAISHFSKFPQIS